MRTLRQVAWCCALTAATCAAGNDRLDASVQANPYSFYGSVAECAAAQSERCAACLPDHACTAITKDSDGGAECAVLEADGARGAFLICIDLALAIEPVATCAASTAPSCPRDTHASESLSSLASNAEFLDDAACGGALDACLASIYGPAPGNLPRPGSGAGTTSPPRDTAIDCSDSWSDDSNCDSSPDCEVDGPSCEDSASSDGACSSSNEQSGCDDSGDNSCSGDSEDSCGSEDNTSCDSSDCGGGNGGDCSSDSGGGGDCGGGGGDCGGGGGGDCGGGGGGDCGGGGGGDCNVAGSRGRGTGGSLLFAVVWAALPLPFAALASRRARRRRVAAQRADARPDTEVATSAEVSAGAGGAMQDAHAQDGEVRS